MNKITCFLLNVIKKMNIQIFVIYEPKYMNTIFLKKACPRIEITNIKHAIKFWIF